MTVTVRVNTRELGRAIAQLRAKAPQAITKSLNRAATSARVVLVREIARDMGLTQAVVKDRVKVEEAKPGKEFARISGSLKRIPLIEFKARGPEPSRGRGRGVTARFPGGAGRYPHAFIATMRSGHRGVFERKTLKRLPVHELRGPSVGHVFMKYFDVAATRGQEQLVKNLRSEFRFALRSTTAA